MALLFTKYYLYFGLLTGMCYGLFNFFIYIAVNGVMDLRTIYLLNIFSILYYIGFHSQVGISLKQEKGTFWTKEDSAYIKSNGKLDIRLVVIIVCRFFSQLCSTLIMYLILITSIQSGINASIIFSIYAGASIFCSLAFYVIYKESLSLKHVLGIIIVFLSVVLIANGNYEPTQQTKDRLAITTEADETSVIIPITLAIVNCFIFVFNSILVREVRKTKISTSQYTADSQLMIASLWTVLGIHQHFYVQAYTWTEAMPVLIASIMYTLGLIFFNGAISYGIAGPVQAMIQIQAPFQLILEVIFTKSYPSILGLSGMVVCIAGALLFIFSKH
eukprot:403349988